LDACAQQEGGEAVLLDLVFLEKGLNRYFPFKNIYPSIQKTGEQEREELFSPVLLWKN
jgi:hypothetical protein